MKRMMVRYTVKADKAAENEDYIRAVFEQLRREQPDGLHYASFTLDDGRSFVHLVSIDDRDENNPLNTLSAFKAFTAQIDERCEEQPVFTNLNDVGAYRLFDA